MRRISLLMALIMLLSVVSLIADKLKIYKSDGTNEEFLLSEINRIETKNLTENYQMYINQKDGNTITIGLSDVEKIEYSNGNLLVYIGCNSTTYDAIDILGIEFKIVPYIENVTIGTQVWMTKNLDVTHYRNGDEIPQVTSPSEWANLTTGAWCYYDNDSTNGETYGKLYNCYAVNDPRGLAPDGWHVPSDSEWKTLEMYLGMTQAEADSWRGRGTTQGSKLAGGYDLWNSGDLRSNSDFNSTGFSGLPGGFRDSNGDFYTRNTHGVWWASTEYNSTVGIFRYLYHVNTTAFRSNHYKTYGISVRCLRDYTICH